MNKELKILKALLHIIIVKSLMSRSKKEVKKENLENTSIFLQIISE